MRSLVPPERRHDGIARDDRCPARRRRIRGVRQARSNGLPRHAPAAADGAIRVVIVMPAFEGFSPGAFWQDMKMGIDLWRAWRRMALVTDVEWMKRGTEWFGWMTPGEVKQFPLAERAAAIAWAAG